jgi:hypothetical protein
VPIQCSYHDESSTALRPKNIFGVIKFIFKKF